MLIVIVHHLAVSNRTFIGKFLGQIRLGQNQPALKIAKRLPVITHRSQGVFRQGAIVIIRTQKPFQLAFNGLIKSVINILRSLFTGFRIEQDICDPTAKRLAKGRTSRLLESRKTALGCKGSKLLLQKHCQILDRHRLRCHVECHSAAGNRQIITVGKRNGLHLFGRIFALGDFVPASGDHKRQNRRSNTYPDNITHNYP